MSDFVDDDIREEDTLTPFIAGLDEEVDHVEEDVPEVGEEESEEEADLI